MAPARWRQIEQICDSALDMAPARRSVFLDRVCAGDPLLRREVETLLACTERAERFLEVPALEMESSAPDQAPETEDLFPPGAAIGPYRIVAPLGEGGMGRVYRARDTRLERDVALKFLPAGSASDAEALKRFHREARAASALNHPNICTLYDIGEHEGEPFLVMELLEGQSLKQRLAGGPLPVSEVLEWGMQISDALHAAHSKGILHRDIKPGNVFLTSSGYAKILDFGLAKLLWDKPPGLSGVPAEAGRDKAGALSCEDTVSRVGAVMGTVAYMSPEQARGEEVDARADLFSLGATLYQAATGELPFRGDTAGLMLEAIAGQPPRKPRELNPQLPPGLEAIILKSLEKDRTARYQSAAELRAELERLHPAARTARWPLALAAALLVALIGIVIGTRSRWFGSLPSSAEVTPRQITANPAQDPVVRVGISADGDYVAYTDLSGIHLRRIDSGETRTLAPEEGYCFR